MGFEHCNQCVWGGGSSCFLIFSVCTVAVVTEGLDFSHGVYFSQPRRVCTLARFHKHIEQEQKEVLLYQYHKKLSYFLLSVLTKNQSSPTIIADEIAYSMDEEKKEPVISIMINNGRNTALCSDKKVISGSLVINGLPKYNGYDLYMTFTWMFMTQASGQRKTLEQLFGEYGDNSSSFT